MRIKNLLHSDQEISISWIVLALSALVLTLLLLFPHAVQITALRPHYLPVHTILEIIGILTCFAAFVLSWATAQTARATSILFLGLTSFAVGWLDIAHTLSFAGMPDFVTPSGPDKAIYFWIASRLTDAAAFLFVALTVLRPVNVARWRTPLFWGLTLWATFWFVLVLGFQQILPPMFVPGLGLTPLKVFLEWSTLVISAAAGAVFVVHALNVQRRSGALEAASLHSLACAALMFAFSGVFFTAYRDVDDLYNLMGHVYKAIAYGFVYRALFIECVFQPYEKIQRLATEAAAANDAKSRFLANVSHEFRTPLGIISGYAELLVNSKPLDKEGKDWSETIRKQSDQLRVLIDDLLDLSKAESESLTVQWHLIPLEAFVKEVMDPFKLLTSKKGLKMQLVCETDLPARFATDPHRLRQILVNLLGNAVKYTSEGEIEIALRSVSNEDVEISITDTGVGIDSHRVDDLFRPFSQIDDSISRRVGGTGLGLALSKRLASLLGGDLRLDRSALGKGSTFTLALANHEHHLPPTPDLSLRTATSSVEDPPDFQGRKILAVEDSPENQFLLKRYLSLTGAEVAVAGQGEEALEAVLKTSFDLILMDIQMPVMDGFEATLKIREHQWPGPILALTAHTHRGERERALRNGFNDYLIKPISKEQLWNAILRHLPSGSVDQSAEKIDTRSSR